MNDTISFPLDFLDHNRRVREKLEDLLTRARDSGYLNLDEAAYRFYAARLMPEALAKQEQSEDGEAAAGPPDARGVSRPADQRHRQSEPEGVSSVPELVDLVRRRRTNEPRFLFMEPEDLRDPDTINHDADAFPAALPLVNSVLPLNYAYKPGQPDDGVTVNVTVREAEALTPATLDWAVPGHLEAKVEHYLRALPKELRRAFVPLGDTAKALATQVSSRDRLTGRRESLPDALAAEIAERFRVAIDPAVWADKPLPDHLRVRIRVVDNEGKELSASRELAEVRSALLAQSRQASIAVAREEPSAWRAARAEWETPETWSWTFGTLPERVLVAEQGGTPAYAFPGLLAGTGGVARRLFKTPEEADRATRRAVAALLERQIGHDLMWAQRDLRGLREVGPLASTLAPLERLQEDAFTSIRRWVTDPRRLLVTPSNGAPEPGDWSEQRFAATVERGKTDLRGLVPKLVDLLREILGLRQELIVVRDPPPGLDREVEALVPATFLAATPYPQLAHLPRYLKAKKLRTDRWRKHPAKDAERIAQLTPYETALMDLRRRAAKAASSAGPAPRHDDSVETFRWLLEEFRVSLFAQELGTAEPVSAVKLDRALTALRAGGEAPLPIAAPLAAKPIIATPIIEKEKKSAPLKNLGALDKLFGR